MPWPESHRRPLELPMRKFVHPGQSIGLRLTTQERQLLTDEALILDEDYVDRIQAAPPDRPEVPFTLDELDDLCGNIAFNANHAQSKKLQKALDAICAKIQHLLETHTDDQEEARKDAPKDVEAASIDPQQINPLRRFMAEFEGLGIDVDALLEKMKPKTVAPEEKVPVALSASEKPLLLGLAGLDAAIRQEVAQTPLKKRTVALTLAQVNGLEKAVAAAAKACADKKLARKWRSIHSTLTDVQTHYTDGTEPTLEQALAGQPISPGAMVRQMLLRMLAERKGRAKFTRPPH